MLNITYHFVGREENLKGISIEKFTTQLDKLRENYKKSEITLTFDHGTIDHINYVAPELEKRGMKGLFFILTMAPEEKRIPIEDKQRRLESLYRKELCKMLCNELKISYQPKESINYLSWFRLYSPEERYLRYLRDKKISTKKYGTFINNFFKKIFGDEGKFAEKEYLNWKQIIDLYSRGHIIGSHGHYHIGDKKDFTKSINLIETKIKKKVTYISYPNGVKKISDKDLKKLDIKIAYTTAVEEDIWPFCVQRVDCNQLNSKFFTTKE